MTSDYSADDSQRLIRVREANKAGDVDYLLGALKDPATRRFAARFLGALGCSDAAPQIVPLLYAENFHDRISGVRALGQLGYRDAIPRISELASSDPVPHVRGWAGHTLGLLGDRDSVPLLLGLLVDPAWQVRSNAATALGMVGDMSCLDAVRRAQGQESLFSGRRRAFRNACRSIQARQS